MLYSFILVQKVHYSNLNVAYGWDNQVTANSTSNKTLANFTEDDILHQTYQMYNSRGGIDLWIFRTADKLLDDAARIHIQKFLVGTISIFFICLMLIGVVVGKALTIKSHVNLDKITLLGRFTCLVLVMF
jgi:hypothetical protein